MEQRPPTEANATDDIEAEPAARRPPRPIIVHYHLFKNAGTSLDRTLRANFRASWASIEAEDRLLRPRDLGRHLANNPWIAVLSSHTAQVNPPRLPGIQIIPVVFARHPIDRIRSVYDFEHKQQADTDGARGAKFLDFRGYVSWRLGRQGDRALRNFQTARLAAAGVGEGELERALNAVATLPFVGLVEAYEESLARLQALLSRFFPQIDLQAFHDNATDIEATPMEVKLAQIRERLGDDVYVALEAANRDDLALWQHVCERYGRTFLDHQ